MARNYLDPALCLHGFEVGRTRAGEPLCPVCRRAARAATRPTAPQPRKPRHTQPVLDPAMLAAGDDTFKADVVPINTARRTKPTWRTDL